MKQDVERVAEPPLPTDHFKILPEVLILNKDNTPKVSTQLVQTKPLILGAKLKYISSLALSLTTSIPKPARAVAFSTFAVSVGFTDLTLVPGVIPPELSPVHGTAVSIDNHYLLAPAHICEYDTGTRNYPIENLKYK